MTCSRPEEDVSTPGRRILVIDDEASIGLSCKRILGRHGHDVQSYDDPQAGLQAALTGGQWWWVVFILLGGLLATAYVFRFFSRAFSHSSDVAPGRPVPRVMEWTAFALAICAILLGLTAPAVIRLLMAGNPI